MQPEAIDVSTEMQILKKLMKRKQFKITPQRLELASWIFRVHDHFTVDDIAGSFRNQNKKISTATIYRMVQTMEDLGLIIKHDFGKGPFHYEHTTGHKHHDHIICNDCGKVFEFTDDYLEDYKTKLALKNNFKMTTHSLHIFGDCIKENCQNLF